MPRLISVRCTTRLNDSLPLSTDSPDADSSGTELSAPGCPARGEWMQCIATTDRPGWSIVMNSLHRPG